MRKTKNIEYIVDEKGQRKSVVMSYRAYLALLEDIADLRVKEERKDEIPEDLESVLSELRDAGRL